MKQPYKNRVDLADCVRAMRLLAPESADIVIADPPYNIGKDFGGDKDRLPLEEYVRWSLAWIRESLRVLAGKGSMFIYGFPETLAHVAARLPHDRQRWLQWHYRNKNMPNAGFWQRSHESILIVWKNRPVFNIDDVREPYSEEFLRGNAGKLRPASQCRMGGGKRTVYNAHPKGAMPRDVVCVPALAGGAGARERLVFCKTCKTLVPSRKRGEHARCQLVIHPTQKPLALTRRLIASARPRSSFNVLIPFCGSGSECLAAVEMGGLFQAYDLNGDYVEMARAVLAGGGRMR